MPMGFRLVPKVMTFNDLEWRSGRYFPLFHQIWQLWGPITSKWSKLGWTYTVPPFVHVHTFIVDL